MNTSKTYSHCGEVKLTEGNFSKHRSTKDGYRFSCKDCDRKWRKPRPIDKQKANANNNIKRKFGITEDEYLKMENAQGGVCGICRKPETTRPRLSIDHDHQTGRIRGLLCNNCNLGLGHFKEDLDLLYRAEWYLMKEGLGKGLR